MLTPREKQILDCIRDDPMASQEMIATRLGLSRAAVAVHITNLGAKGAIRGRAYVLQDAPFVVAVGGASVDITGRPDRRLRPADSNPGCVSVSPGGVARNVAENLARLGVDCRLISVVGDDSHGELLANAVRTAGIGTEGLIRLAGRRTSTYVSIINERGELSAGVSDMDIMEHLDAELLQEQESSLRNASALFIDANLSETALTYLFDHYSDKTIIADPVSVAKATRLEPFLSGIDILKPTLDEAGALLGRQIRSRRQAPGAARALLERGVQRVFVSLGAHGVLAADASCAELVPAESVPAVTSVSGAGDALVAGLVFCALENRATVDMAEFANAVASIALHSTAASVSASALRKLKDTYPMKVDHHA